jgi:hypothetical protein
MGQLLGMLLFKMVGRSLLPKITLKYKIRTLMFRIQFEFLQDQQHIHTVMNISAFLNPADAVVDDAEDEILDHVIDSYAEGDRTQETDEEDVEVVRIRQSDAMQAVRLLQTYEEQQEDGNTELLRRLAQMEVTVRRRMVTGLQQAEIMSFFAH